MINKKLKVGNVPNLRFPEFSEEWEVKKLGEIATFSKGKGISKSDIEENGITECIRYGELYTHYREVINEIKSKTNVNPSTLILSEKNDVIIPASGETTIDIATASCVLKSGIALGGDLNIIKTKNNGIFLSYYLNSKKKMEIANLAQGISVVHLYSSQLASLSLSLPKLNEQNRISSFLALLDERIQTQNKIIEQLETLIKGLSEKLFSQEIRFKEFTDKWELKKLGDISTITTGSSNREDSILNGEYTFFDRSQDIRTSSRFLFDKEAVIVPGEGQEFIPKYFIGKFDLHQRTYAIFDFRGINGKYLYYHLLNDDKYLQSQAVGSTVKSLRLPMFQSMPIKSPCLDEQTTIANFLSVIETKIQTEKNILDKYHSQKQYLLQNLFI
ncbi:restriction endonuclease subunit S [Elizabethkingia anophelis]|uniref:restriction endonuclease subunit S n=1 Tax=Elizabethkingia anophelis TaxID=1117645 RepID=UPI001F4ADC50|nr:restriction endonuclease subunit S [Elizabethkingia anophelis]